MRIVRAGAALVFPRSLSARGRRAATIPTQLVPEQARFLRR